MKASKKINKRLSLDLKKASDLKFNEVSLKLETLLAHGLDLDHRSFRLVGDIDEDMFALVDDCMTVLENINKKTITIKIHSSGGDLYSALGIIDRIRRSGCLIKTEGYGKIMSAATAILAVGNKRSIGKYSWFMHHETNGSIEGTHSAMRNEIRQWDVEHEQWSDLLATCSKKDKKFWKDLTKKGDVYLDAEKLLEYGVVDEII